MKKVFLYIFILISLALFLILAIRLLLDPIETIYNVSARTEIVEILVSPDNANRLQLHEALLFDREANIVLDSFEGGFAVEPGTALRFERIYHGPLVIRATCQSCGSVGRAYRDVDGRIVYEASDFVEIIVESPEAVLNQGNSLVFPIMGEYRLGRSVEVEVSGRTIPLLQGGTVSMTGVSNGQSNYFDAGEHLLSTGDFLVFLGPDSDKANGFVALDGSPAMNSAYRIMAQEAEIIRPGPKEQTKGFPISASFYDRLIADKLFQVLSLFLGVLIFLTTLLTFMMDIYNFRKTLS
ncbi:hypothetical protein [Lewinella sp. IMCC34183]|uniref:hypothetical protein n=1 Tax=Lewinella sp. IMCC34183 TaxID=2248762 RepID=UPI000E25664F|nr:hypothetical protein [Lewinella sp. IMCC34183]